jgi:tetratricopeptide (TPR) repeat protein
MTAVPIATITLGRGNSHDCEICGRRAAIQCKEVGTFYCSEAHFNCDWEGVRKFIVSETVQIRAGPPPTAVSEAERRRQQAAFQQVIARVRQVASEEAMKHLIGRNFQAAVGAGLEALKMTQRLKLGETEIAACHLLLAEANLGMDRLPAADDFLTLAAANINASSGPRMVAQLQRNLGKLQFAQGKIQESLRSLAANVYYTSVEHGPEAVETAAAYFYLGAAFASSGDKKSSVVISKAIDIYMKYVFWEGQKMEHGIVRTEALDVINKAKEHCAKSGDKLTGADCEALIGLIEDDKQIIELATLLYSEGGELALRRLERIKNRSYSLVECVCRIF